MMANRSRGSGLATVFKVTWAVAGTGPRSPRRGAPYTYVTTEKFLAVFDLQSLQDLPDREQLEDAGLGRR